MITVAYDVNTSGVRFTHSTGHFILRDGAWGKDWPELKDLMSRGGHVGDQKWIPETPVTRKLLDAVEKLEKERGSMF